MWSRSSRWVCLTVGCGVVGIFVLKRLVEFCRHRRRRGIEGVDGRLEYVGRVTRLCLYPVKACNGVYVRDAYVGSDGLRLHRSSPIRDRHWGILEIPTNHIVHLKYEQNFICISPKFLDENGRQITADFANAGDVRLVLDAPETIPLPLPVYPVAEKGRVRGVAEKDVKTTIPTLQLKSMTETKALEAGKEIDEWLNKHVGCQDSPKYRLMVKPAEFGLRQVYSEMSAAPFLEKAKKKDAAAFQSVAPLQIMNESSVEDLNNRLLQKHEEKHGDSTSFKKVSMVNFRANIIVDGGAAYDEDSWSEMWIAPSNDNLQRGDLVTESSIDSSAIHLRRLAPCQRCTITTVDPETGKFRDDKEPLVTLMKYRRKEGWGSSPVLGSYVGVDVEGDVRVGDAIFVTRQQLQKPNRKKVQTFEKFWGRKF